MAYDVAIIGGGVIGLASAYFLAKTGAKVTVLERQAPGSGASPVAAGMLTPAVEADANLAFLHMGTRSRDLWPAFAASLLEDSAIDPELVRAGVLKVAGTEEMAGQLRDLVALQTAAGVPAEYLSPAAVAALLPGLGPVSFGALHAPQDAQVQPTRVLSALHAACIYLGVDVRCGEDVRHLLTGGSRVIGVQTSRGPVTAGTVVLAAGSWSGALAPLGLKLPVEPVKGQLLALQAAGHVQGPWVRAFMPVFAFGGYYVPKRDGRILVGATTEPEAGFDATPTLGGILKLGGAAATAFPASKQAPVAGTYAGLRPGTPDHLPMMGPAPGWEGLVLATGHYRHGILMAPLTGQAVAAWALGSNPEDDFAIVSPERFQ